ncbi:MAG: hypothetical protein QM796_22180 [Chthoniobacteraceae bacterium]
MKSSYTPKHFEPPQRRAEIDFGHEGSARNLARFLAPITRESSASDYLVYSPVGQFVTGTTQYRIARYLFLGPKSGSEPLKLALLAGFQGDTLHGPQALVDFLHYLNQHPGDAPGTHLYTYPVCNPTGFEEATAHAKNGRHPEGEFWQGSRLPEVYYLERELGIHCFNGVVSLVTGDQPFLYASSGSKIIREHIIVPALEAASIALPSTHRATEIFAGHAGVRSGFLVNETELAPPPSRSPSTSRAPLRRKVPAKRSPPFYAR